ncbi:och1, partial [Symbiodinium microadriaticum]
VRAQRPGHKCPSLLQTSRLVRSRQGHVGPAHIPCLIHQTWKTHRLDSTSRDWFATWSDKNPSCEHKLWNDTEVAALVQSTSPDVIWPIWQGLLPVERADAFRYLVLWAHGGYYADIDVSCLVPISEMQLPNDTDMIVGYETGRHLTEGERDSVHFSRTDQFEQWFFASAPRNPVLLRCLELIRQKFGWRIESTEELTGPATFTDAVHEFLLTETPDALSNLIAGRSAGSGRLFPSESLYKRGNWSMWVLASGRVSSPGYSSGDDPGSPLVRHHFRGTWKPEELRGAE